MKRSDQRRGPVLATKCRVDSVAVGAARHETCTIASGNFHFLARIGRGPGAVAIGQAQDRPAAAPSNPVAAQSLEQLSTILDHPLFSPSRRPPAPPPAPPPIVQAAEPPAPPPPPPNLVLFGVVMDGEGARAVVRSGADKKLVRAQIGDEIDGWKVSQIEGRKVVLSLDGRFATFTLFSDDRGKSESAGGPAPVGETKESATADAGTTNFTAGRRTTTRSAEKTSTVSRVSCGSHCSDILSHTRRNRLLCAKWS